MKIDLSQHFCPNPMLAALLKDLNLAAKLTDRKWSMFELLTYRIPNN